MAVKGTKPGLGPGSELKQLACMITHDPHHLLWTTGVNIGDLPKVAYTSEQRSWTQAGILSKASLCSWQICYLQPEADLRFRSYTIQSPPTADIIFKQLN